jgi:hypothetical protein
MYPVLVATLTTAMSGKKFAIVSIFSLANYLSISEICLSVGHEDPGYGQLEKKSALSTCAARTFD